jgi:hypothetical protein
LHELICFFPEEISHWPLSEGMYSLYLPKFATCRDQFAANLFNDRNFERPCSRCGRWRRR